MGELNKHIKLVTLKIFTRQLVVVKNVNRKKRSNRYLTMIHICFFNYKFDNYKNSKLSPDKGLEPLTSGLKVPRSTD